MPPNPVDQNLQAIRAIEGAWSLPALPDEVKLDLASNQSLNPTILGSFLNGLAADVEGATKTQPLPTRQERGTFDPATAPSYEALAPRPALSGGEQVAVVASSLMGFEPPRQVDPFAVQRFKQRATDEGYLDLTPEQIASPTWLPEYSSVAKEMAWDAQSQRFQGAKPGSFSTDQVFSFLDEWLSPRGLYKAATELDLWWDFEQIGEEFDTWGDRYREWKQDPWNVKKMLGMLGPVDDVVLPLLNIGLLFTGVGEVLATGKALWGAGKVATAASEVAGIHRGVKGLNFLKAVDRGADIDKFREASYLAKKIAPQADDAFLAGARGWAANTMQGWRQLSGTVMAKKVNQQIMRAGFASNLQQAIDRDRGTRSVAAVSSVDEWVQQTFQNPLVDWGTDVFLTPYTIFEPGTIKGAVGLVTAPARKAAVLAGVKKLSQNEHLAAAAYRPLREYVVGGGLMTEKQFERAVRKRGLRSVAAEAWTNGDEEELGRLFGYVASMGAVEAWANNAARMDRLPLAAMDADTTGQFLFHRDKMLAQLRLLDEDDIEGAVDHLTRYGIIGAPTTFDQDMGVLGEVSRIRNVDDFERRRFEIKDAYRETAEEAAARGGAVADGHVRLYGERDVETGRIKWRPGGSGAIPVSEALRRWDELPDDTLIEVYHSTSPEMAERFTREGIIGGAKQKADYATELTGEGLYVGDDPDRLRFLFGGRGPEVPGTPIGITVRKGDLGNSPEGLRAGLDITDSLRDPLAGAHILDDVPADRIRILDDPSNPTAPIGDPLFIDVHVESLRRAVGDEDAARMLAGELDLDHRFERMYMGRADDGTSRFFRLSEAPQVRLYKQDRLEALRQVMRAHNQKRGAVLREMMDSMTPEFFEQYLYETMDSFGDWAKFDYAEELVEDARLSGLLDDATFVPAESPTNRRLAAMPWMPDGRKWVDEIYSLVRELPDDEQLLGQLRKSMFSPFARDVNPSLGRFTVQKVDNVTKQQALAFAATVKRPTKLLKAIRKLKATGRGNEMLNVLRGIDEAPELAQRTAIKAAIVEQLGEEFVSEKTLSDLARIAKTIVDEGVSFDEIERTILGKLNELDQMAEWAEKYRVPSQIGSDVGDVVSRLDAKVNELQKQAYYLASEVENIPADLAEKLAEGGYRLVYGVNFALPRDLEDIFPEFLNVGRGFRNKINLRAAEPARRFFQRQDNAAVSRMKARKVADSVHAALSQVDDGLPLNLGPKVDFENPDMRQVMDDLWDILHREQELASQRLAGLPDARFTERVATRASLARTPMGLDRLASDLGYRKLTQSLMRKGYSEKQANAIYRGIQRSQALGVRHHGLYAIESHLRSRPNLIQGLRFLGTTSDSKVLRRGAAGAVGAFAGGVAVNMMSDNTDPEGNILGRLAGTIGGGALGALISPKVGLKTVDRIADAWEHSSYARFAYVADNLANVRDFVRFSLSPLFDASRYSEAILIGQLGYVPDGLKNLRVNQSPRAFRKMLAKESGLKGEEAVAYARREWDRVSKEFAAAARGDFDWEVVDGITRRFSSVGILGFSPADWMASTFGHIRRSGVEPGKAYELVREMYTYGTTGRSAAELSMNFVFFPFSYSKKLIGHLGDFYSNDLTRLVVLQDMVKTYETLDEHFDLEEYFRDRLPILERAHRLNPLAYGFSLGQFGGVNKGIIETGLAALRQVPGVGDVAEQIGISPVLNAFLPQMLPMNSAEDAESAWELVQGLFPVWNDVQTLMSTIAEQGYVMRSPEHVSRDAELRLAWEEWRAYQDDVNGALDKAGLTWDKMTRIPEAYALVQAKRAEISEKYPTWKLEQGDGIANQFVLNMEKQERLTNPKGPEDVQLAKFEGYLEKFTELMRDRGASWERPEDLPPEFFTAFRNLASDYVRQNPKFLILYNRFYRRQFGDITTEAY